MKDISSDKLMDAMLEHQLDGNEMKMIIAYVRLGGWKHGTEVFLPEAKRKEWGIADRSAPRLRKSLVEKGWLIPTGNKSRYGCDKYKVVIPASRVCQTGTPTPAKMAPEVCQNGMAPLPNWHPEVTKEVTKEVKKKVTKVGQALQEPVVPPSSSLIVNNKPDDLDSSLIGSEELGLVGTEESQVCQNGTPSEEAPVLPRKIPCPGCSYPMDRDGLCWEMGCTV